MQRGNREVKEAEGENKTCNHTVTTLPCPSPCRTCGAAWRSPGPSS